MPLLMNLLKMSTMQDYWKVYNVYTSIRCYPHSCETNYHRQVYQWYKIHTVVPCNIIWNTLCADEYNWNFCCVAIVSHLSKVAVDGVEGVLILQAEHKDHGIHPQGKLQTQRDVVQWNTHYIMRTWYLANTWILMTTIVLEWHKGTSTSRQSML